MNDLKRIEPGIYRVQTGVFRVVAFINSGAKKATGTVRGDIHEARKMRDVLRDRLLAENTGSSLKTYTVDEALSYYVDTYYNRTSRYHWGIGKTLIQRLRDEFKGMEVGDLNKQRMDVFIFRLKNSITVKGNSFKASGVNPYIVTLKAALTFCVKAGNLAENPLKDYSILEVEKTRKKIIPEDIRQQLKAEMPEWSLPMIVYKELVPCRYLELCDTPMSNISDDCRILTVPKDKNGHERELPIPEMMSDYFRRMRAWGSPWAFARPVTKDGIATFQKFGLNTISQIFKRIRRRHGWDKDFVPRILRHTAVSAWLRKFDIGLVSEVAGASPETLHKYYDVVSIEAKQKAADAFADDHKILNFHIKNDSKMILPPLQGT